MKKLLITFVLMMSLPSFAGLFQDCIQSPENMKDKGLEEYCKTIQKKVLRVKNDIAIYDNDQAIQEYEKILSEALYIPSGLINECEGSNALRCIKSIVNTDTVDSLKWSQCIYYYKDINTRLSCFKNNSSKIITSEAMA